MIYTDKRLIIIKRFIVGTAAVILFFGLWRISTGHSVVQGVGDLVMSSILLTTNWMVRRFPKFYDTLSRLTLFLAMIFIFFTYNNIAQMDTTLLWLMTFVLFSFLLRSRSEGWFWVFFVIVSFLLLNNVFVTNFHLNVGEQFTLVINLIIVAYFATWYEQLFQERLSLAAELNNQLEERVAYRTRELLHAKEEAKNAQLRAEEASRAKSSFLANMSHEMRTPLNAITGFIALLKENETDTEKLEKLQTVQEASEVLTELISDILDLGKIESGQMQLKIVDFDPKKLLLNTVELYQIKAREKGVSLDVDASEFDALPVLRSDTLRIRQVLNNLLSNALKFTPKGGHIAFHARYADGELTLQIADEGIGIAPENIESIFDPFRQTHDRQRHNVGGTGLGLAICRQIARLMGGEITVESVPGKGSTFSFTIPVEPGNLQPVSEETPVVLPDDFNAHILIVEDIRANQMFIEMVLQQYGLSFDVANNGQEAVTLFQQNRYDLILMDENMPVMNGTEATKEIRRLEREENRKHTPIVALTANAIQGDRERLLQAGMDDYLSKPVTPQKLIRTIAVFLAPQENSA